MVNKSRKSSKTQAAAAAAEPSRDAAASRRLKRAAWIGAGLAALFVLTVLLSVDYTVAWALVGVLHVGKLVSYIVAFAGAGFCLWIGARFFRVALRNELAISKHHPEAG